MRTAEQLQVQLEELDRMSGPALDKDVTKFKQASMPAGTWRHIPDSVDDPVAVAPPGIFHQNQRHKPHCTGQPLGLC